MAQRVLRVIIAGITTFILSVVASLSGLPVEEFLAGVFGGGALTAAYLAIRGRTN